jgi:lipopolysaccharide transport system ATP-binding protein
MSDVAISVNGLGKQYRIGAKQEKYQTLGTSITKAATAPFRRAAGLLRGEAYGAAELNQEIWALRDVNFDVKHGEVLGIIGHNGAGKSTLLKILSRITEPSEGYADINGRVGSLLEVGTGFHNELTGRENIYLNSSILGMTRNEIDRKFDEIIDFAGVDTFIDTPVKHYSSGMRLRLGFSVAAHLEPEILIVDEVLAVGDAEFQNKCLGKMGDVAAEGRTVLLVSHNMSAILSLSQRVIWLDHGTVHDMGVPREVVQDYLTVEKATAEADLKTHAGRKKNSLPLLRKACLMKEGKVSNVFHTQDSLEMEIECEVDVTVTPKLNLGFDISDGLGSKLFGTNSSTYGNEVRNTGEPHVFRMQIDKLPLVPGKYSISLYLGDGSKDYDVIIDALSFDVIWDKNIPADPPKSEWGSVYIPVQWTVQEKVS